MHHSLKDRVIDLYKRFEHLLKIEDKRADLKKDLEKSNPNYLDMLEKRRNDMGKTDHGIVITGFVFSTNKLRA